MAQIKTLLSGILLFCLGAFSQPRATFEVASVKPSAPDVPGMFIRFLPGGGLRVSGASLKNLICLAYGVRAFQVAGGPGWVDTDRFEIDARGAASEAATEDQRKTNERLRNLLADRFHLAIHPETREQPVYALVVAKGGPKLQESAESGSSIRMLGRGALKARAAGMGMLALNLSNELGRRVVDKTGLASDYSFELKWTPFAFSTAETDPDRPALFTALEEQLGLRLESSRGPVELLVIDGVERPSAN